MGTDIKKKIVFVNSFKGGAGKTTLSLTHCIDSLFHTKEYENVIYLDLDIMGTAVSYLFAEDKLPDCESFDKTSEPKGIELKLKNDAARLYIGYLSPEMKTNAMYGEACFINHQKLAEEIFIKRVMNFIEKQMKEDIESLIVLDCAPGFGEIEQKILDNCYRSFSKKDVKIEEEYLVTLDAVHIKKCIQCLKDNRKMVEATERYICIVVNDIQNYWKFVGDAGEDAREVLNVIMQQMNEEAAKLNAAFRFWRYSQSIAVNSVYTKRTSLENQVDDYLFTPDNYMEWKRGTGFA